MRQGSGTKANFSWRVIQSLEEAEQARNDFLQLKEKAEFIISQLQVLYYACLNIIIYNWPQGEASRHPASQTQVPRKFQLYEPVAPGSTLLPQGTQTFPKQKGGNQAFVRSSQESDSGSR